MSTGGLWGGPLFVLLFLFVTLLFMKAPPEEKQQMADACAIAFPLSLAVAKIGCFLNECCHGFDGEGAAWRTAPASEPGPEMATRAAAAEQAERSSKRHLERRPV